MAFESVAGRWIHQRRPVPGLEHELHFAQRRLGSVQDDRFDLPGLLVDDELGGELDVRAEIVGDEPDAEEISGFGLAQVDRSLQPARQRRDLGFELGQLRRVGTLGRNPFVEVDQLFRACLETFGGA
jgi:hypothetical protein